MLNNHYTFLNVFLKNRKPVSPETLEYAILLVKNKKIHRIVQNYGKFYLAEKLFNAMRENNTTVFPSKYRTTKGDESIYKNTLEILFVRKKKDGSEFRKIYTGMGIIEEKVNGDWEIIQKFILKSEECFKVYGYKRRLNSLEILSNIFLDRLRKAKSYEVYIVNNKIVITDSVDDFNMILCHNVDDAKRLYNFFLEFLTSKNMVLFMFRGIAATDKKKELMDEAIKHLGVSMSWMKRYTTEP
jgi:hypothetical protein